MDNLIEYARRKGERIAEARGYAEDFARGFVEGYVKGWNEQAIECARRAKQLGLATDIITQITGLKADEISLL